MWPVYTFNLVAAMIIAGLFLRGVWRLERRRDERSRRFNEWANAEDAKWDTLRDEIRASMRAKVDAAIAEMNGLPSLPPLPEPIVVCPEPAVVRVTVTSPTVTIVEPVHIPSRGRDQLPSEDEIRKLPQWAQVAFTARCARRVLPLYSTYMWPTPRKDQTHLLALATSNSETGIPEGMVQGLLNAVELIHQATFAVAQQSHSPALYAMQIVQCIAAAFQLRASTKTNATEYTQFTIDAMQAALSASADFGIEPPLRDDFDAISRSAAWFGTVDTSVSPSIFGPLWPEGAPKGWPKPENPATEFTFEFDVPDEMTTAEAVEWAKALSTALCELDLAGSGHGLAIQPPLEITIPVGVRVPV